MLSPEDIEKYASDPKIMSFAKNAHLLKATAAVVIFPKGDERLKRFEFDIATDMVILTTGFENVTIYTAEAMFRDIRGYELIRDLRDTMIIFTTPFDKRVCAFWAGLFNALHDEKNVPSTFCYVSRDM